MEAQTVTSSQPAAAQKALPETQEGVQGVVAPILQQRGADVTVRQVREDLLAAGYTEADINAKSELIKQSCFSLIPEDPKADGDKGDAKAKKEKKNKKNAEAQPAANFVFPVNPFTVLPPQEMVVGRFTAEEDALLMQAMDASLHARTHEVPLEVARTVLAGDKIDMAVPVFCTLSQRRITDTCVRQTTRLGRIGCATSGESGRRLLQDTKRGQWTPVLHEFGIGEIADWRPGGDGEDCSASHPVQGLAGEFSPVLLSPHVRAAVQMEADRRRSEARSVFSAPLIVVQVGRPAASCKDIYRHRILGSGDQIVSACEDGGQGG
eukprot:759190-Hanusia_phi.AAC.8